MLATKFEETRVYREIREERSQEIAINLLRQGFTVEAIAQATDLTLAQVQDLQSQDDAHHDD
jgi:predicted transposase YdaD